MTVRTFVLSVLALLAVACSDEITRTQLTFALNAGPSVRQNIDTLRVTVRGSEGDLTENFRRADLNWPVEIVVLPRGGNDSTSTITLLVSAFGAGGSVLAQQTTSAAFKPERVTRVEVALGSDAVIPEPDAGADAGPSEPARDSGGAEPEPDASEPEPVKNCQTDSKNIKCDDGNKCNGLETCNPKSSSADAKGCVPSDTPVMCTKDMTCDSKTGECSTCLAKPDGDGDGADSIACGGLDCNDSDEDVAPGKTEKCNNRDDDCDGVRDGTKADPDCRASAPTGGTASCVSGVCTGACTKAGQQIVNGVCVDPPAQCPVPNPCLPGSCAAGSPTYVCECPITHRAGRGNTRCAPIGVPTRTLGFETSCDGMPIASPLMGETILIGPAQFAACGVNMLTAGSLMMTSVQLVRPAAMSTTMIEGITGATVLEVPAGTTISQLSIGFSQPVTELGFDLLDIDNPVGVSIALRNGNMEPFAGMVTPPVPPSKRTRYTYKDPAKPVDQVVITYSPLVAVPPASSDRLFIDQLSYRVGGCGDMVVEGIEACDDGDLMQCNGCDNACALSSATSPGCAP